MTAVYFTSDDPVVLVFVVLPLLLVAALAWGVAVASRRLGEPARTRRLAAGATLAGGILWMAATAAVALNGMLMEFQATPPPFGILVLAIILLAILIAFTGYGRRLALGLPLWALVAVQAFRLPLEIAMHGLYERNIMPVQMSYTGRNFDIVTGATAIIVSIIVWGAHKGPGATAPASIRRLVLAWNILGLILLTNIVAIAVLSTPRFRYFGEDRVNIFVTLPPFVWLPAVMVLAALAGHLIIWRALRTRTANGARDVPA
jgi:hypothetical protein